MIVATAGHVDHGKTLLVKAITGIDADRLPEEKQRGMTIDLGFAYWRVDDQTTIGFVDVPGHERFIRNMLCGVASIDFVLLVVAADDGVMPQTREHLAIIDLLGVTKGLVALTKTDRVTPERVADVTREIRALLTGTRLAAMEIIPVSSVTGEGIATLKMRLTEGARRQGEPATGGNFRLAIDRSFTIAGAGLVVTGTVFSGGVTVGDTVRVLGADRTARVRSLHAQNRAAQRGRKGERCALNLSGPDLHLGDLVRGDWVASSDAAGPVARLDVRLKLLTDEKRPLRHWTPVHVHLGAADVIGRVALLEDKSLAAGQSGLAQLILDRPLGAVRGDKLILRDQSAQRTIGGGTVIDIVPPRRGRGRPERLAYLKAMESDDDAACLAALLAASPQGLDLSAFAANRNLTPSEADALFAAQPVRIVATAQGRRGFTPASWERLKALALERLADWHRRIPGATGPSEDRVFGGGSPRVAKEVAVAVVADLAQVGAVVREGGGVRLPTHQPKLAAGDAALWRRIEPLLDRNPLRPPSLHELAASAQMEPKKLESLLVRVSRLGLLVRIAPNRFFRPSSLRRLGELAASLSTQSPNHRILAAEFRDSSGIGRNVAIEVLEYFDRVRLTRRIGDAHELVGTLDRVFGLDAD
jgi:selenocysteine-specific elongation factor